MRTARISSDILVVELASAAWALATSVSHDCGGVLIYRHSVQLRVYAPVLGLDTWLKPRYVSFQLVPRPRQGHSWILALFTCPVEHSFGPLQLTCLVCSLDSLCTTLSNPSDHSHHNIADGTSTAQAHSDPRFWSTVSSMSHGPSLDGCTVSQFSASFYHEPLIYGYIVSQFPEPPTRITRRRSHRSPTPALQLFHRTVTSQHSTETDATTFRFEFFCFCLFVWHSNIPPLASIIIFTQHKSSASLQKREANLDISCLRFTMQ